jgi:hypothetical protein
MSCIRNKEAFDEAVKKIIIFRFDLLTQLRYSELLTVDGEEAIDFFREILRYPGEQWRVLKNFKLEKSVIIQKEREQLRKTPNALDLPPVNLKTLIRLSDQNEAEKTRLENELPNLINPIIEALNMKKLISTAQWRFYSAELTTTTVYDAVYEAVLRLASCNSALKYIQNWMTAFSNKETAEQMTSPYATRYTGAEIRSLNSDSEDERSLEETIKAENNDYDSLERAEAEHLLVTQFVLAAEKIRKTVGMTVTETSRQAAVELKDLFNAKNEFDLDTITLEDLAALEASAGISFAGFDQLEKDLAVVTTYNEPELTLIGALDGYAEQMHLAIQAREYCVVHAAYERALECVDDLTGLLTRAECQVFSKACLQETAAKAIGSR